MIYIISHFQESHNIAYGINHTNHTKIGTFDIV